MSSKLKKKYNLPNELKYNKITTNVSWMYNVTLANENYLKSKPIRISIVGLKSKPNELDLLIPLIIITPPKLTSINRYCN